MQTFLLAQAVIEHSMLSTLVSDATYQFHAFIEDLGPTQIFIGLGIIVLLMFWWRPATR